MDRTLFALSLGLAGMIACPNLLHAAPQCATHDDVSSQLAKQYGETPTSMGLAQDNTVMEVYSSAESGSWTITVTLPTGMTCLVAAGQHYESAQVAKGDPA